MNVMLSTAAGLLAADAFCKKRRLSNVEASTASDSSSDASSARRARRKTRSPSLSSQDSQTSSSTLEPSISSESSSEASTSDSGSESDSESSSDESRVPIPRRLTQRNLQRHRHQERSVPRPRDPSTLVSYRPYSPWSSTSTESDSEYASSCALTRSPRRDSLHQHAPPLPPRPHEQQPDHHTASSLHSRVSAFLPAIRASNDLLRQKPLEERDIEMLNDAEAKYIEMDLGLGVLEEHGNDSHELKIQRHRAGEYMGRFGKENTPSGEHDLGFRRQHIENLDHQAQRATYPPLDQPSILEERSPGLSTKRERSRESVGRLSRQNQEDRGDLLGTLMGREYNRAMTPEMRERKRRRMGIEVL